MKVHVQSDLIDGFVLADPAVFEKMDENILRAMDIYLDKNGESELVYDFPGENLEMEVLGSLELPNGEYSISYVEEGMINYTRLSDGT